MQFLFPRPAVIIVETRSLQDAACLNSGVCMVGGTGRYQVGRRGARLASLVREAAGEVEAAGTPAVAHLMGGAVRDIAALAARPPSASESALLQVCTHAPATSL